MTVVSFEPVAADWWLIASHFPLEIDFPGGSDGKASVYNSGDLGSSPGLGRSPGEGNGNPLQYYCLENPMDRGAWSATVYGFTKSRTRLSDFTFTFPFPLEKCYRWTYLQSRNRGTDIENKCVNTEDGTWGWGTDLCTRLCINSVSSKSLLHSTRSSAHCSVVTWWEGNPKKKGYVCSMADSLVVEQEIAKHCKAAILP